MTRPAKILCLCMILFIVLACVMPNPPIEHPIVPETRFRNITGQRNVERLWPRPKPSRQKQQHHTMRQRRKNRRHHWIRVTI